MPSVATEPAAATNATDGKPMALQKSFPLPKEPSPKRIVRGTEPTRAMPIPRQNARQLPLERERFFALPAAMGASASGVQVTRGTEVSPAEPETTTEDTSELPLPAGDTIIADDPMEIFLQTAPSNGTKK